MKHIIRPATGALVAGMIAAAFAAAESHAQSAAAPAAAPATEQTPQGVAGFGFGKQKVPSKAMPTVDELANMANSNPESKVVIEGHTDNVGNSAYNQTLGMERAQALRSALVRRRVDVSRITVQSLGAENPVASNDTREGRRENRRAQVMIGDTESRMVGSSQGSTSATSSGEGEQSGQSGQGEQSGQSGQSGQNGE